MKTDTRKVGQTPEDDAGQRGRRSSPLDIITWEGRVERLTWGGLGISRLGDGKVLLLEAPLALFPGERVRAAIRVKSKHAEGAVKSWRAAGHRHPGQTSFVYKKTC